MANEIGWEHKEGGYIIGFDETRGCQMYLKDTIGIPYSGGSFSETIELRGYESCDINPHPSYTVMGDDCCYAWLITWFSTNRPKPSRVLNNANDFEIKSVDDEKQIIKVSNGYNFRTDSSQNKGDKIKYWGSGDTKSGGGTLATGTLVGNQYFTKLYVPRQYPSIGSGAFSGNTALSAVTLNSVRTIGDSAFSGCTTLREVYFTRQDGWDVSHSEECDPSSCRLREIGASAFCECAIWKVGNPENQLNIDLTCHSSLSSIGECAFCGSQNHYNTVWLPSKSGSKLTIGSSAFTNSTNISITINGQTPAITPDGDQNKGIELADGSSLNASGASVKVILANYTRPETPPYNFPDWVKTYKYWHDNYGYTIVDGSRQERGIYPLA